MVKIKKYRVLTAVFVSAAVLLSQIMCAAIAFNYARTLCGIEHLGYSAPANIAFLLAIPYGAGILALLLFALWFWKKGKNSATPRK